MGTRATLGTIDYLNKIKKEKRLKLSAEEKVSAEAVVGAAGSMSGGNQLSGDQIEKTLVPELRAALKERGIRATGNKAVLRTRLKNPSATDYTRQQQQKVVESQDIEVLDD